MFVNLLAQRPTFVSHLECSMTGERYDADRRFRPVMLAVARREG